MHLGPQHTQKTNSDLLVRIAAVQLLWHVDAHAAVLHLLRHRRRLGNDNHRRLRHTGAQQQQRRSVGGLHNRAQQPQQSVVVMLDSAVPQMAYFSGVVGRVFCCCCSASQCAYGIDSECVQQWPTSAAVDLTMPLLCIHLKNIGALVLLAKIPRTAVVLIATESECVFCVAFDANEGNVGCNGEAFASFVFVSAAVIYPIG